MSKPRDIPRCRTRNAIPKAAFPKRDRAHHAEVSQFSPRVSGTVRRSEINILTSLGKRTISRRIHQAALHDRNSTFQYAAPEIGPDNARMEGCRNHTLVTISSRKFGREDDIPLYTWFRSGLSMRY
ncbi:hypothetical protein LshimejAT787_1200790 [Lyophyllum shimeji]|uniref:Uncharacterized protein n=1 Tax=Lyophyllum shimeji TaxID=47721 RepID=A0A9P3PTM2_LYOSH|nr:hypothetical protein LshimejAT787_1200790 [Lyophyllum shimeji]